MADPEVAQAALDRAFDEREQLLLLYQPIHSVATGALYGAEALLRQLRRSGEIREASIISDTAEENGGAELYMLDNIVVRKAYREASRWPEELRLHVNLSPRELQAPNLRERVSSLEIDPHRVC
ncbi:MAG TPA: EAL domain-containing protein, partial [Thermoanaerobaculia bacterium]|nr:EAL domain-containing protein [Thermoanaerobaculia bacterium]